MPFRDCNQPAETLEFAKAFAAKPQGFLLLAGRNGTGKTYLAECILCAYRCDDTDHRRMITQTDLNLRWQRDLADWNNTTHFLGQLLDTRLLVIDDLGTRTPTPAFMDWLYALVEHRERRKASCGTVITTNLNAEQMRRDFGDAFVSRVASGNVIRFDGADRRFKDF